VNTGLMELIRERASDQGHSRINGVVIGIVTNNKDDEGLGRVKVRFPWLSDTDDSFWARIATPMGGNNRGMYFLPELDDEVLVAFEHGDVRFPYIVGSLWNGKDKPPASNTDGKNNLRLIQSRSGHVIKLNDEDGKATVEIIDASGKNSIVIDTAHNTITITAAKDIVLAAAQGSIKLQAQTIEIQATADATIDAKGRMSVTSSSDMVVQGSTVNIN
jgi:uncharacterized protein involved in type VI secretion and phage assembly